MKIENIYPAAEALQNLGNIDENIKRLKDNFDSLNVKCQDRFFEKIKADRLESFY